MSDISRLFDIPYFEQVVKRPFDTEDPSLLILKSVLASEGGRAYGRPIIAMIEVEKMNVGQENRDAWWGRWPCSCLLFAHGY